MLKLRVLILSIFFSGVLLGGKIDRAFEALNVYDYFQAKSLFEELLTKEPVAAPYGLSIIHFRQDNPFHDLDKAYAFISMAERNYAKIKSKDRKKLLRFYIDSASIALLNEDIVVSLWDKTYASRDIDKMSDFIRSFSDFNKIDSLVALRNDLAFENARKTGTVQSYREFYTDYPGDPRAAEAKYNYEKMLFEEKTREATLQSYVDFVHIYPDNQFVDLASKRIFELSTEASNIEAYKWFVERFPLNPEVKTAWERIFVLSFTDFSDAEFDAFKKEYPDFPYRELIDDALKLRDLDLHKITVGRKWGYINSEGAVEISPRYEFENDFSNGYALVANEEFVGYINKKGEQLIPFIYDDGSDFVDGVARVSKGDAYGLINKLGTVVLGFKYDFISDSRNGILVARSVDDNKFRFYRKDGRELFPGLAFDYAANFEDNFALVGVEGNYGVLDSSGEYYLKPKFKRIIRNEKGRITAVDKNGRYGLISLNDKDTVVDFKYAYIGKRSEGKYAVFNKTKYGYVDTLGKALVSQRLYRYAGDTLRSEFKGGYAVTGYRGKYGIIDSLGGKFFPNIFDEVADEIIPYPVPCSKRGKWGYISKQITMWEPYKYDFAGAFKNNVAIVALKGKYGVIDKRHNVVVDFKYDLLSDFNDEYYLAKDANFFGLVSKEDQSVLLPFYYSKIEHYQGDVLRLHVFGEYQYYNIKTRSFIYGVIPEPQKKE